MNCHNCEDRKTVQTFDKALGIVKVVPCPTCNPNGISDEEFKKNMAYLRSRATESVGV